MLIDLHAHSAGISACCLADYMTVLDRTAAAGLDGIVLTNHYLTAYYRSASYEDWIEAYLAEYRAAKRYGEKIGLRVYLGAEISLSTVNDSLHLLLYGIDEDFLRKHSRLCERSQKELFALAEENNALLIQAHPLRPGCHLLDTAYLHGIELNCHPAHRTCSDSLPALAEKEGLLLTAGGDYHADVPYRPVCGVFLPDDTADSRALAAYLKGTAAITLRLHETDGRGWHDVCYPNPKGGQS